MSLLDRMPPQVRRRAREEIAARARIECGHDPFLRPLSYWLERLSDETQDEFHSILDDVLAAYSYTEEET